MVYNRQYLLLVVAASAISTGRSPIQRGRVLKHDSEVPLKIVGKDPVVTSTSTLPLRAENVGLYIQVGRVITSRSATCVRRRPNSSPSAVFKCSGEGRVKWVLSMGTEGSCHRAMGRRGFKVNPPVEVHGGRDNSSSGGRRSPSSMRPDHEAEPRHKVGCEGRTVTLWRARTLAGQVQHGRFTSLRQMPQAHPGRRASVPH